MREIQNPAPSGKGDVHARAFRSADEVPVGGIVETKIGGRWCRVVVLGQRAPEGAFAGRFDVRREPRASNCLNPRDWFDLRPTVAATGIGAKAPADDFSPAAVARRIDADADRAMGQVEAADAPKRP